jgi:hypothetical protein
MIDCPAVTIAKDTPDRSAEHELRWAYRSLAWPVGAGTAPG